MIRYLLATILLLLFLPSVSWAALLYLEPSQGEYYRGDNFIVDIRIDTEGECINIVKGNLKFSQDILEAVDFSQGDSILTLWVEFPAIDQATGLISFSGGIPAGFCGKIPGDPGESNLLGRIIFSIPEEKQILTPSVAQIEFLAGSQVLLNDGLGTPAQLSSKKAVFTVMPGLAETAKQEWQAELAKDKIPPEDFEIEISQDLATFEGKYFVIFFTTDQQTGLDYYEIKEGQEDWQKITSPYLLKDQSLQTIIKVKAVDKAGNERMVEYVPLPEKKLLLYLIVILILPIVGVICWMVRKRSKRQDFKLNL